MLSIIGVVIYINNNNTVNGLPEKAQLSDSAIDINAINESISELADALRDSLLKSSIRLLILMALATNKRLTFTQLLNLTGGGKGSLNNNLSKLEEGKLIKFQNAFTLKGPRLFVTITENGLKIYRTYINLIKNL